VFPVTGIVVDWRAKTETAKDAGSAARRQARKRARTQDDDGLQPPRPTLSVMGGTKAAVLAAKLRGPVSDERVLAAIASIPRERFVPARQRRRAYANQALPIDCGQTISQPLVVARMLELLALRPSDRVLDVGTGSGYHAALLSLLAAEVWTIERHPQLSSQAAEAIAGLGIDNVSFIVGDGREGFSACAPYDAINVAAAAGDAVPAALEAQLALGGRLVAPVGAEEQRLVLVRRRTDGGLGRSELDGVRFVPLVHGL
jgi:protein-L-isoaspartate(D-aspartate) O-methyltransferase